MSDSGQQPFAKVLFVDDTDAQRYALSRVLRGAGFDVIEAATGRQALQLVQAGPDLVVLDVNLPDISGLEVCREIKSHEGTARIPVLHVSASMVSTDARVAGLNGGADGYLVQPIAPDELIATVRALLRVKRAEEALWRSNEQYRLFFEATPLPCWVFDNSDLRILAVNAAAVENYGYSREEFTRMSLRDLVAGDGSTDNAQLLRKGPRTPQGPVLRKHKTKDGRVLDVEVTWAPLRLDHGDARLLIIQDVTEKRKRQAAQQKEEVRRLLLERILQVQEEERQRLARELHDEAGQLMTSLLVGLRTLSDSRRLADAKLQADRLREIASQAITELSRLARGLHSSVLEDLGLQAAVRRHVDELLTTHKLEVALEFAEADVAALDRHAQLNVYRIVQEALTNVLRHSQASAVVIRFEEAGRELHVTVTDNGRGLSSIANNQDARQHLGIEGMRERAAMLGGTLEVASEPGHGTTVQLRIPRPKKATPRMGEVSGSTKIA
jgi:PAS domain S-box-containing protein